MINYRINMEIPGYDEDINPTSNQGIAHHISAELECPVEFEGLITRARSLSAQELEEEVDGTRVVSAIPSPAHCFRNLQHNEDAGGTKRRRGSCRQCGDLSVLIDCVRCGYYNCEDCMGTDSSAVAFLLEGHHACFDCIRIIRLQKKYEERARNEIAKELIPLPQSLWESKRTAKKCLSCTCYFSPFAWRHNCKGCGEVMCSNRKCLVRRVLKDGKKHKVCYTCSGGDDVPAWACCVARSGDVVQVAQVEFPAGEGNDSTDSLITDLATATCDIVSSGDRGGETTDSSGGSACLSARRCSGAAAHQDVPITCDGAAGGSTAQTLG